MKRTALTRGRARLARSPLHRPQASDWPPEVRAEVSERSGGRCEIGRPFCTVAATDLHHRRRRREGDHGPLNALHCCRDCHSWCHGNPQVAREFGWIVSAWANPASVAVLYRGRPLLLTHPDRKAQP